MVRILALIALIISLTVSISVSGAVAVEYKPVSVEELTNVYVDSGEARLDSAEAFKEYVMITNCPVYKKYFQDDFKWNRLKLGFERDQREREENLEFRSLHYKIPTVFEILKYNFDTHAFDIADGFQFSNAELLPLTSRYGFEVCDGIDSDRLKVLPGGYEMRAEVPLSLKRIPVSDEIAQVYLEQMTYAQNAINGKANRQVFATFYVTLDGAIKSQDYNQIKMGRYLGRIDKIEFFVDQERTKRFKTIDFNLM